MNYPLLKFDHHPSFPELWEACTNTLIYDLEAFASELEQVFVRERLNKHSRILDAAAGGGFPALALAKRGYDRLVCTDGSADMVTHFNRRAAEQGIDLRNRLALWEELPTQLTPTSFDLVMCRGNSFIYAPGGWNKDEGVPPAEMALACHRRAAKAFRDMLAPGGVLLIDKFKDTETSHREAVGRVQVGEGEPEKLIFWTERDQARKIRRASMLLEKADGTISGLPNVTYDLSEDELRRILLEAGFATVEPLKMESEKYFDIWLART